MSVVNIRLSQLRKKGYKNLEEWLLSSSNHMYVGRNLEHYLKRSPILHTQGNTSIDRRKRRRLLKAIAQCCRWANPFKIDAKKNVTRQRSIQLFEEHARRHLVEYVEDLCVDEKEFGCWCWPLDCHADTLSQFHREFCLKCASKK